MRHAVYVAPHGGLADPRVLVDLAVSAEETGWDGVFLWDHLWRPDELPVSDAMVCLAAMAVATSALRLGPMVTPLARRRPQKVARETAALDHLSRGRLTFGVGLGVNTGGELAHFAEEVDNRQRGDELDEALALLLELWSGDVVNHRGPHFTATDVSFVPVPVQRPRIPVWVAARGGCPPRPLRRAARMDGFFPVGASLDQVRSMLESIERERGSLAGYDVACIARDGDDLGAFEAVGATWLLRALPEDVAVDEALRFVASGPKAIG
jgi:alkanesulfonate monooxygenase SsuD/methylene tetrahydromethanopterin reductase-like flavin-dependent oxidoreductase (luciferase family)